jgi:hypothetical protein
MIRVGIILAAFALGGIGALAQESGVQDTIRQADIAEVSYADKAADTTRTQNPTAALFKSMFVPGWGQIGNKRYIKAGVIIAVETYLIANLIHQSSVTQDAKRDFDNPSDSTLIPYLYNKYKDAKDTRNLYSWFTGLTIFISMFDAYVDAHLARFPKEREGLSLDIAPAPKSGLAVNLKFRF